MAEFQFHEHPGTNQSVILAPRRAHRTNEGGKKVAVCPFCIGQESGEEELYRVGGTKGDSDWQIRVIPNKFPFTLHHELIIHSPDHHKNIDELPFEQVELIFQTYRERYRTHSRQGQVYLFHNRGHAAGESLPHPHTQLTVIPHTVNLAILPLDRSVYAKNGSFFGRNKGNRSLVETDHFLIFCPATSDWPDEVWVAPKKQRGHFGSITETEITDLAFVMSRLIQIFDLRHGYEFPFNFYIAPGENWYLRLVPRLKILGGFEVGTNVIVNTQDPKETFGFIAEHFWKPNTEKIKGEHHADYLKSV